MSPNSPAFESEEDALLSEIESAPSLSLDLQFKILFGEMIETIKESHQESESTLSYFQLALVNDFSERLKNVYGDSLGPEKVNTISMELEQYLKMGPESMERKKAIIERLRSLSLQMTFHTNHFPIEYIDTVITATQRSVTAAERLKNMLTDPEDIKRANERIGHIQKRIDNFWKVAKEHGMDKAKEPSLAD